VSRRLYAISLRHARDVGDEDISSDFDTACPTRVPTGEFAGVELIESLDDFGVELKAPQPMDFFDCSINRPGPLVGAA
jgi:hypothetical protein